MAQNTTWDREDAAQSQRPAWFLYFVFFQLSTRVPFPFRDVYSCLFTMDHDDDDDADDDVDTDEVCLISMRADPLVYVPDH